MNARNTPRLVEPPSPTGATWFPQWLIRTLFVLNLLATTYQGAQIYDLSTRTWQPNQIPIFICLLAANAGIASQGLRRTLPALVLALGLTFSAAPALAQERLVFGVNPTLAGDVPRLADYLSLSAAAGAAWRPGVPVQPLVTALGLVHLARPGPNGPLLSAALGGQAVLPDGAPAELGFFGGLGLDLPGADGQRVKPVLVLGTAYQPDGWRLAVVLGLRLFPGG